MKNVAIIGCGFVVQYYMFTLSKSEALKVVGVLDSIRERAVKTAEYYSIPKVYNSLQELLADDTVEIVLNLTNPRNHYETSMACLEAGKHVYTEKPLAMTVEDAKKLVETAERKSLQISSAPCSLLGETAQTIWKALRENQIGTVRLVYAELDEDLVHRMHLENVHTSLGVPWPAKDEYEIGVTLEHAGYYLTWLAAFFGPAKTVTASGSSLIPEKMPGVALDHADAPDFTVACIEFQSGTVARVTCSIVASHDHTLRMFGDDGILSIDEGWNYGSPVHISPRDWNRGRVSSFAVRALRRLAWQFKFLRGLAGLEDYFSREYPLVRSVPKFDWQVLRMDFSRGVRELAESIQEKRESRLSTRFSLHITELVLAIHHARMHGQPYRMTTTFEPVKPMPWAT